MMDARTLIVVTTVVLSITAMAMFLAWLLNRRMAGAGNWTLGYLSIAAGTLLQSQQDTLHPLLSIGLANHVIVAGFYICWWGTRRLQDRDEIPLHYFLLLQLSLLLALAVIGLDAAGLAERTVLVSLLLAALALLTAKELLWRNTASYTSDRITGMVFLLLGITFVLRASAVGLLPASGNLLTAGSHSNATYLAATVLGILIAFGYILMLTERLQRELRRLADTDHLTGLHTRRSVVKLAEGFIQRAGFDNTPVSLVVMDLDKFKSINDSYGHLAGDCLIKHFAESLQGCLRSGEVVGRIGGEEFVAVLPDATIDDAVQTAERIRTNFEKGQMSVQGRTICATVSIGVACCDDGQESFEGLFRRADEALYRAKAEGRNRVIHSTPVSAPGVAEVS